MKITKSQLRKIIKEEIQIATGRQRVTEDDYDPMGMPGADYDTEDDSDERLRQGAAEDWWESLTTEDKVEFMNRSKLKSQMP